jgi:hypothetical protein
MTTCAWCAAKTWQILTVPEACAIGARWEKAMSKYKYDFGQEFGAQRLSAAVDLVDDFGFEESELDGLSTEDMRDLLYDTMRNYFRVQSRFMWSKIDG